MPDFSVNSGMTCARICRKYQVAWIFLKTLSSRGVHIRPSVMVAPPFILECITPNCLAHGNEGEATPTTEWMMERAPRSLHSALQF